MSRFIIDDVGSLIDVDNGDMYDYVWELVGLLNDLNNKKEYYNQRFDFLRDDILTVIDIFEDMGICEMNERASVYFECAEELHRVLSNLGSGE